MYVFKVYKMDGDVPRMNTKYIKCTYLESQDFLLFQSCMMYDMYPYSSVKCVKLRII